MEKLCTVQNCNRSVYARGWCGLHYQRVLRDGEPGPANTKRTPLKDQPTDCRADGCPRAVSTMGFCRMHYNRQLLGNDIGQAAPYVLRNRGVVTCEEDGCLRVCYLKTWCRKHYFLNRGTWACSYDDCDRPGFAKKLCERHYTQWNERGRDMTLVTAIRNVRASEDWGKPYMNKDGYMIQFVVGRGNVGVHRLVMEERIGRPLFEDENVHHKNGVRGDNQIENLELWSRSQPPGQRVEDKLAWAHEMIARYEK